VIQDEAANGLMEGLVVQHQMMETLDKILKPIVISLLQPSGEAVDNMGYQLNLSTPKRTIRKETETLPLH